MISTKLSTSSFISVGTCLLIVALTLFSCYHITLITQTHTVKQGGLITGKMVVKATGGTTNGSVSDVTGLFGIRVPEGWTVQSNIVMTQVPKPTTDVGDDAYKTTIHRKMVPNRLYTDLLNSDYPKDGYTWMGFATESDFKTLVNYTDRSKEIDSIYVEFSIKPADGTTGVFYLDYVGGHVSHGDEGKIGTADRDWNTRVGTFYADKIAQVVLADTRVTVTDANGVYDVTTDELYQPAEWELAPMHNYADGKVKAYKDLKYNKLFTRTRGWNGGDGVLTVGLPNGDVFWTFNDSFYGVVDAKTRARGSSSFPRNSVMLQRAHDGVPGTEPQDFVWLADYVNWTDPTKDRYFHARTHLRHPGGEKTDAEIKAGDIDQGKVYWSGDGTVYNGKLQMLWMGTESSELRCIGTALATYSLDGTIPKGYYLDDIPDYLPQKGNYLYRESVKHDVNSNAVSYGSTLCEAEDGHTYLYATNNSNVVVARTATHDLYSKWQYYVKEADGTWKWQDDYPDSAAMARSGIQDNERSVMLPWVFKKGSSYFMVTQPPIYGREVHIYRSKNPWGPFTDRKLLFRLPDHLDKLGSTAYMNVYMVNLHPALAREGELVFSTNTESFSFWDNFNAVGSADFYRPFFYRVFDWETLYPDLNTGVSSVKTALENSDNAYYNLQGMKVLRPIKGHIYIHRGKKVVVR